LSIPKIVISSFSQMDQLFLDLVINISLQAIFKGTSGEWNGAIPLFFKKKFFCRKRFYSFKDFKYNDLYTNRFVLKICISFIYSFECRFLRQIGLYMNHFISIIF